MCYDGKRRNFHYSEQISKNGKIFSILKILFRTPKVVRNREASWRQHSCISQHYPHIKSQNVELHFVDKVALLARLDIMTKTTTSKLDIELIR